jgi:PAS domain S-box-containing protein
MNDRSRFFLKILATYKKSLHVFREDFLLRDVSRLLGLGYRSVLLFIACVLALLVFRPDLSPADMQPKDISSNGSAMDKPPSDPAQGITPAISIGFASLLLIVILLLIANLHRRRAAKSLQAARDRYESMFKHNAVALFEEDCLAVKAEVEKLKDQGVTDIPGYLNTNPQHVLEMAKMLKVLDVNPAALRLYGADSKEELLESFVRIFTPDSLDGFKQVVAAIAEGRTSFECETVSRKLTGQRLYVILSATFPPSREEFARILFSVVDITDRKRSQEVMHRSEERFRTVFDNAASGMALVDLRGHYIRVNEAFQRMLGYTAKELEWKNWREVTYPEDVGLTKKMIISLIAGQRVQPLEKRYINKQGETVWALLNIALIVNKRRKPLYYICLLYTSDAADE